MSKFIRIPIPHCWVIYVDGFVLPFIFLSKGRMKQYMKLFKEKNEETDITFGAFTIFI